MLACVRVLCACSAGEDQLKDWALQKQCIKSQTCIRACLRRYALKRKINLHWRVLRSEKLVQCGVLFLRTAHCVGMRTPGYSVAGVQKGSDAFRAFMCLMKRTTVGPTSIVLSAQHTVL